MPISECPAFASIDDVVIAFADPDQARRIHLAGWFKVDGTHYRVAYGKSGPEVVRRGVHGTIDGLCRHIAIGPLASPGGRLARRLALSPQADRHCLIGALDAWRNERPEEGRAEAAQRLLRCRDDGACELDLRGLRLSSLPPAIGSLQHLGVLRLGGNRLGTIPAPIKSLRGIRVLELDRNRIDTVPSWLAKLSELQVLSLNANRIAHWPRPVTSLRKLALLWLEDNAMRSIPLDVATAPQSCETFVAGNPWDELSRDLLHAADRWRPDAPIHYDRVAHPSYPLVRRLPPGSGALQRGRLPAFVHVPADGEQAPMVYPVSCLTKDEGEQCRSLIRRVAHVLAQADVPLRRTGAVLDYRLDLIERWLRSDAALWRQCSAAILIGLEDCVERLVATLDDVEIAVIEAILGQRAGTATQLAALGRGLFRLDLLGRMVCRQAGQDDAFWQLQAYRTMLADELSLPLEVRRVAKAQWTASGLSAAHVDAMRDTVLRLEAQDDYAGLDDFMSAWKPWQQYVRQAEAPWMEQLNLGLQQALDDAAADMSTGACTREAYERLVRESPQRYEALFRQRCRDIHRALRAGASQKGSDKR